MTSDFGLVSAFLIGLAGSIHCVGMCGGIVGAFSMLLPKNTPTWPFISLYNAGRILSYMVAGSITGYLGSVFSTQLASGMAILNLVSGLFLLLLGLYLGNWWRVLTYLEQLGSKLWRYLSPLSKKLLPMSNPMQALPYGIIWGWLPCGLVYSTLTWSMASGSALDGALVMLFFGLGTLPSMMMLGGSAESIKALATKERIRQVIAVTLIAYALFLLAQGVDSMITSEGN